MARAPPPADATPVTWEQVHAFRMARHHLDRPVARGLLARAVADSCGIQAQVMAAAQLALRVRVRGLTLVDVDRALWKDRSLARTWSMRGTVHIVPSRDLATFVRGTGSRQQARVSAWLRRTGGADADLDRLVAAFAAALDRPRTRAAIAERVRDALGAPIEDGGSRGWGGPANVKGFRVGRSVVTVADLAFASSYRCLSVFGPDAGDGGTFVRPDAWLRDWKDAAVETAEDNLLRRYLHAFGPATVHDFNMWSVVAVSRCREIWSRIADELRPVSVQGRSAWILRADLASLRQAKLPGRCVRLLPYFDSFLMGHKERGHLVDAAHYKRIYRPAGWVYPAVLVDGHVAGEWSYDRRGQRLQVRIRPYEPLDQEAKELVGDEAADVARFLGAPPARVSFGKPR